jgi:hypothetical protein
LEKLSFHAWLSRKTLAAKIDHMNEPVHVYLEAYNKELREYEQAAREFDRLLKAAESTDAAYFESITELTDIVKRGSVALWDLIEARMEVPVVNNIRLKKREAIGMMADLPDSGLIDQKARLAYPYIDYSGSLIIEDHTVKLCESVPRELEEKYTLRTINEKHDELLKAHREAVTALNKLQTLGKELGVEPILELNSVPPLHCLSAYFEIIDEQFCFNPKVHDFVIKPPRSIDRKRFK